MTFDPKELEILEEVKSPMGGVTKYFTTPITPAENIIRMYEGKTPMWAPFVRGEQNNFKVACDPENNARGPMGKEPRIDGYGVEWVFVKEVGGAMVKPGNPAVTDISKWEECVTVPDPDSWDWEGFAANQLPKCNPRLANFVTTPSCLFERLIAIMDFEGAVVALIDEDQKDDVHRFFRTVIDVQKKTYSNIKKYINPPMVNWNDDMGSQRAPFFSTDTYREMIFPYVKEIVDHIHSLGMYVDLHSCGMVEPLVPMFIEAGFDSWGGQPLNDKVKLKEKYDNGKFVFTVHVTAPMDATEEELDAIVAEFITGPGADNRVYVDVAGPEALKEKIYAASRKNYDKLVAEGKAVL